MLLENIQKLATTQYRFTVRLKLVKSTVSVEVRVFGLNLLGGGKYFGMFSYD